MTTTVCNISVFGAYFRCNDDYNVVSTSFLENNNFKLLLSDEKALLRQQKIQ